MADPDSEERIRELEERMAAMPGSRIFAALADEYRRAGLHEAALHILQTGLVNHPTYLSAQIALARLYQEMGKTDSAIEAYQKVLATDRENLVAAKGLAEIHESRGELVDAIKRWKLYRALSGDRDIDARIQDLESRMHQEEAPVSMPEPGIPAASPLGETEISEVSENDSRIEEPSAPAAAGVAPAPVDREFDTLLHAPSLNQVFSSSDDVFPIEPSSQADGTEEAGVPADFAPPPAPEEVPPVEPSEPEADNFRTEGERETEDGPGAHVIDVERTEPMRLSEYVSDPAGDLDRSDEESASEAPVSPVEIPPSRTLADLYLEQGYSDDARKMYERLAAANPLDESVNLRLRRLRHGDETPAPAPSISEKDRIRAAKLAALESWLACVRGATERGRGSHV
jgi:tetratricopeptide (TPR) repeat protein